VGQTTVFFFPVDIGLVGNRFFLNRFTLTSWVRDFGNALEIRRIVSMFKYRVLQRVTSQFLPRGFILFSRFFPSFFRFSCATGFPRLELFLETFLTSLKWFTLSGVHPPPTTRYAAASFRFDPSLASHSFLLSWRGIPGTMSTRSLSQMTPADYALVKRPAEIWL